MISLPPSNDPPKVSFESTKAPKPKYQQPLDPLSLDPQSLDPQSLDPQSLDPQSLDKSVTLAPLEPAHEPNPTPLKPIKT